MNTDQVLIDFEDKVLAVVEYKTKATAGAKAKCEDSSLRRQVRQLRAG
jgi:hypothetical protein